MNGERTDRERVDALDADDRLQMEAERGVAGRPGIPEPGLTGSDVATTDYASLGMSGMMDDARMSDFPGSDSETTGGAHVEGGIVFVDSEAESVESDAILAGESTERPSRHVQTVTDRDDETPSSDERIADMSRGEPGDGGIISKNG